MKKNIRLIVICLTAVYLLLQIIIVSTHDIPFESDSANYYKFAMESKNDGTYYPSHSSIKSDWIVAPVYINTLIVLLSITTSSTIILIFNIVLNISQLLLIFLITKKLFGIASGIIAMLLYVMYLNNLGLVLLNYTELMFGVFILLSIYLYLFSHKGVFWLTSGFILGLALGVRPTAFALYICYSILYIVYLIKGVPNHKKFILVSAGLCIYIYAAGTLAQQNIGSFVFSSTTGPANLIMSANPNAVGVFDPNAFEQDSILATKKTFEEKGSYLTKKSIGYIVNHPIHFISLLPRKIYSTFVSDDWAVSILLNSNKWDLLRFMKIFKDPEIKKKFNALSFTDKAMFLLLNVYHQAIYMIIMILIIYQVIYFYKDMPAVEGISLINSFIWVGFVLSLLTSVGNLRYKYTMLICGLILISPVIIMAIEKYLSKSKIYNLIRNSQ